jgi:hypothetical protein
MKLKNSIYTFGISACLIFCVLFLAQCSGGYVNTNNYPAFTDDGYLITDSTDLEFKRELPSVIKFYVEVSGSMNGFFRANEPTEFKSDVWHVLSSSSPLAPSVSILTDDGERGATMSVDDFRANMNTGSFISSASTKVPLMLSAIIDSLNTDAGEVAVLISDMKYSPVGAAAPSVLMAQYVTDINGIMGRFGKAISMICATSDYRDNAGNVICSRSPYYYVILGKQENVAKIRNYISLLLKQKGRFVDNIDSGFNYGHPAYSFGISNKCYQFEDQPSFLGYEEADTDTCTIKLKVPLENYRWIMEYEEVFREAFKVKPLYGSKVKVGNIDIEVKDVTGPDKRLNREATATVDLKIYDMYLDSDVIEWNLELPDTNYSLFNEFFEGAAEENDPAKSYSVLDFLTGVFKGGIVIHDMKPNYILVSKKE